MESGLPPARYMTSRVTTRPPTAEPFWMLWTSNRRGHRHGRLIGRADRSSCVPPAALRRAGQLALDDQCVGVPAFSGRVRSVDVAKVQSTARLASLTRRLDSARGLAIRSLLASRATRMAILDPRGELGRPGTRRCLPRTGGQRQVCPRGRPRWCMTVHDHTDPACGQPLCGHCYDYTAHLIWQWWAPELWRRFTITLRRRLATHLGLSEAAARERVRVQFAKVAEFQRRGIIHFHALIRLDGPPTDTQPYPPPAVDL